MKVKIVVIGLGSMGKRRIRLINELYPNYEIVGIDYKEERRKEVSDKYNIICYESLDRLDQEVLCAFVCTSPLSHSHIIKECLLKKMHVFTELNLVTDGYMENVKIAKDSDCILFLSSTFLYREEITYIKSIIDDKKWNYNYHVGQYLPDWHPWENYKDFFLGDKRTNGCRELLAIELPWIVRTFGDVKSIKSVSDKITGLNIDYHDNFMIQIEHSNGNKGSIIVDVVSPVAVRKFEAYSEKRYISWEGTPDSVKVYDEQSDSLKTIELRESAEHIDGYQQFIVENAYKNEIKDFFEVINKETQLKYSFEEDEIILKLIDSIGA